MDKKQLKTFIVRLNYLQKSLGVNKSEFARRCGISQTVMHLILSGKRPPTLEHLLQIHELTGVSVDFLIGIKDYE